MFNTFSYTITLYNKYKDSSEQFPATKWKRTVIENCYFGSVREEKMVGNSLEGVDSFVCRILKNKAYTDKSNGETDKFTLSPGDIIVKGTVFDEVEDAEGKRPSDIIKKYRGNAFTVESVSDNTLLPYMPHYRVYGR